MFLYNGLEAVYSPVDKQMLENIRTVLNLERLLGLTKEMSNAVVMQREVTKFITAAGFIDQDFDVKEGRVLIAVQGFCRKYSREWKTEVQRETYLNGARDDDDEY